MKMDCAALIDSLVRLAEGHDAPDASRHLDECPACAARYEQLRSIVSLAQMRYYAAPSELIESVVGLVPKRRRTVVGWLLRSSLSTAGARAVPDAAQLLVGTDEIAIRLMLRREGDGYEVMGELPSDEWQVEGGMTDLLQTGARFRFHAHEPSATAFAAQTEDVRILVPSVEELLSREPGNAG